MKQLEEWLAEDECKEVGGRDYVRTLHRLARVCNAKHIVEVGLGWCYSGRAFILALAENGGGKLTSIDPLDGLPQDSHSAKPHLADVPVGVQWTHVQDFSHRIDPYSLEPADMLYIDGDPRYSYDDAMRFYGIVKKGGLVVLDGVGLQQGPNEALDKMKSLGLTLDAHKYSEHYSLAAHRKVA